MQERARAGMLPEDAQNPVRCTMKAAVVRSFDQPLAIEDVNTAIESVLDGTAGTARTVLRIGVPAAVGNGSLSAAVAGA